MVCNKKNDCGDNSDESDEECDSNSCIDEYFISHMLLILANEVFTVT